MYYGFRGYLEHCVKEVVKKADELRESEDELQKQSEDRTAMQDHKTGCEAGKKRKRDNETKRLRALIGKRSPGSDSRTAE